MFESVLPEEAIGVVNNLASKLDDFYLAGGTGLALQLGHRRSADLDFFTQELFNADILSERIYPDKVFFVSEGTIHCELKKVKLSFLYYKQPLIYQPIPWRGLKIADWKDIVAEKFKAISQRGTKKDFYDLYAALQMRLSIKDACDIFKSRFSSSGINMYHVLKSITFFEDAESEPSPMLIAKGEDWEWVRVKKFFEQNIKIFQEQLTP